jgi:predicted ferric reductase
MARYTSHAAKRAALCVMLLFLALAIFGLWLWGNTASGTRGLWPDTGRGLVALGRLAGLMAGAGILLQATLISRAGWIERAFGHDRLTQFHHLSGTLLAMAILAHPLLVTAGYSIRNKVSAWEQVKEFIFEWDKVGAAMVGWLIVVTALLFSWRILRRRLRYESWYAVHLGMYAVVLLVVWHQLHVGRDLRPGMAFRVCWIAMYVLVGLNLLVFRFARPALLFRRHRFEVDRLQAETPATTSVYIRGRDLGSFHIQPGQFMIVRFLSRGFWSEAHPFSLSCWPDGRRMRLSIKNVGDFTSKIPTLVAGSPVLIDGPYGVFTQDRCRSAKALLIAAGIGITPIRSLAEAMARSGMDVTVLYGNRTRGEIVFFDELEALTKEFPNARVCHVLTHDPGWPGEQGRIDHKRIRALVPDVTERDAYVCGPPLVMAGIVSALNGMGVPRGQIHYEQFSL